MEDSLRHLQKLGFTEYEARAYVALIRKHPATRYQLSQNAAIPESKIYEVVRRLQDKGLISGIHATPPRFIPLEPEKLVAQLEQRTRESLQYLRKNLPLLASQPATQWAWNIEGYDAALSKARELITDTVDEIVAAMWHEEATLLADHLKTAFERGVALFFLAYDDQCPIDFGTVKQHGYKEDLEEQLADAHGRWIVLVADKTQVLIGQSLNQHATSVWTNHSALTTVVRKYVLEHFLPNHSHSLPWT